MLLRQISNIIRNRQCIKISTSSVELLPYYWRVAGFHSSANQTAKTFVDTENKFAHNILAQSMKPYQIFRVLENSQLNDWSVEERKLTVESSTEEIWEDFCNMLQFCASTGTLLSEDRFRTHTQLFCDISNKLTDEQLLRVLHLIALLPPEQSTRVSNYVELWNTLDVECCDRIDGWQTEQLLFVCDAWYALNLARITEFVTEAQRKLSRKVLRMSPEQLVHTMFFCNLLRRPIHNMFDFEANLERCAQSLTLQELGVMAMGFFKTQTPIRSPKLLDHLYRRLMLEVDSVEDITLVAILKVLRYSSRLPQVDLMMDLLDKLRSQIDRLSLLSCLHIALLGSDLQCCHEEIIELILQRFNQQLHTTRLKDLERMCFAIGVFNLQSRTGIEEEVCAKILPLLRTRIEEILKYPRSFPLCMQFLTLKGIYDEEMISTALETRFLQHAYGRNLVLGREIFQLDSFVKINLSSSYSGNELHEKYRKTMGKLLTHYIPERNGKYKLSTTDRVLTEVKETADSIFRGSALKHILPHFERPDIVICYDKRLRKSIPLSEDCPKDYSGVILTPDHLLGKMSSDQIDTIVLVVGGWNNIVRGKDRHTGLFDLKLQQLKFLGHKYVVIYWHEWRQLETTMDRLNLLRRKLAGVMVL